MKILVWYLEFVLGYLLAFGLAGTFAFILDDNLFFKRITVKGAYSITIHASDLIIFNCTLFFLNQCGNGYCFSFAYFLKNTDIRISSLVTQPVHLNKYARLQLVINKISPCILSPECLDFDHTTSFMYILRW